MKHRFDLAWIKDLLSHCGIDFVYSLFPDIFSSIAKSIPPLALSISLGQFSLNLYQYGIHLGHHLIWGHGIESPVLTDFPGVKVS